MATRRTPTAPVSDVLLTPDEAAERINKVLSTQWPARRIVTLVREGQLAAVRVDGRNTVRVHPADLERFLSDYIAKNRVVPDTQVA
ncbi:helix-turn-helix domain-containing protein [Kineosporia sp. R_H_3]|uniref:helix-turn-helix domain-containing protein n=1 Tax=Kineosporia sp. R_H_3 TaxID=1961848 RepID=UPI000B4B6761|nr:helix-turn-helix domain-containing protein [Kineosporia sp. R_H_3]